MLSMLCLEFEAIIEIETRKEDGCKRFHPKTHKIPTKGLKCGINDAMQSIEKGRSNKLEKEKKI